MKSVVTNAIGSVVLALAATGANAQGVSDNRVAASTDWSVFVENDPTECWAVSSPNDTVNSKDGRVVAVRRSDILMFVSYRPGANVKAEVSFAGGYPFAEGSTVELSIGSTEFVLFTSGENAWPADSADDAKIITAMKRGAQAVIVGRSARGTRTQDTFSLFGFSDALDEAEKRCTS